MEVGMTAQDTVTTTIQAPLASVWTWVADITKHAEWSPRPYRVELVSGDLNAVGSRYRSVGWVPPNDGDHANDVEITEVVPMSRFALTGTDKTGSFASSFDLLPVEAGTQVTFHIAFPPMKGLNAVMVPLLFPVVAKPDFRKRLELLKQKVESSP
jgi:uncharacterized protein YndB with AHSA1/START domain